MTFYQDKKKLLINVLGSLVLLAVMIFFYYKILGDFIFSEVPMEFLLFLLVPAFIFFIGLYKLITSISCLLTAAPLLAIDHSRVTVRKNPWKKVTFNARDIISVRYEIKTTAINGGGSDRNPCLVIKSQNQPALSISIRTMDSSADDVYEAVKKYLPNANWRE